MRLTDEWCRRTSKRTPYPPGNRRRTSAVAHARGDQRIRLHSQLYSYIVPLMPELVPAQLLDHVAERFRVLGDATRLTILRTLLEADELSVSELVTRVETTQANVSKHLGVLLRAGIVRRRPEGTTAYYSVADPTLKPICEIVCDRLRDQNEEAARAFATN